MDENRVALDEIKSRDSKPWAWIEKTIAARLGVDRLDLEVVNVECVAPLSFRATVKHLTRSRVLNFTVSVEVKDG